MAIYDGENGWSSEIMYLFVYFPKIHALIYER